MVAVFAERVGVLLEQQIAEALICSDEVVRLNTDYGGAQFVDDLTGLLLGQPRIQTQQRIPEPRINQHGIHRTRNLIGWNILPAILRGSVDEHFLDIGFVEHGNIT